MCEMVPLEERARVQVNESEREYVCARERCGLLPVCKRLNFASTDEGGRRGCGGRCFHYGWVHKADGLCGPARDNSKAKKALGGRLGSTRYRSQVCRSFSTSVGTAPDAALCALSEQLVTKKDSLQPEEQRLSLLCYFIWVV